MGGAAGKVVQVMGPVLDVEFPPGELPEVFTALRLTNPGISDSDDNLVIEVHVSHLNTSRIGSPEACAPASNSNSQRSAVPRTIRWRSTAESS